MKYKKQFYNSSQRIKFEGLSVASWGKNFLILNQNHNHRSCFSIKPVQEYFNKHSIFSCVTSLIKFQKPFGDIIMVKKAFLETTERLFSTHNKSEIQ